MRSPRITIVVGVDVFHAGASFLTGCLHQTVPFEDFELIVADERRREVIATAIDRSLEETRGALNVRYVIENRANRAALNNVGVAASTAELVVFLANDFVPSPSFLETHLRFHERNTGLEMVGIGPGRAPQSQRRASKFLAWLEDSGKLFGVRFTGDNIDLPADFFYVGNASVKKRFLIDAGCFDEEFPYPCCDDYELGLRMAGKGMQAVFLPHGGATHDHPISVLERMRSMRMAGESAVLMANKVGLLGRGPKGHQPASASPGATILRQAFWETILKSAFLCGYAKRVLGDRGHARR